MTIDNTSPGSCVVGGPPFLLNPVMIFTDNSGADRYDISTYIAEPRESRSPWVWVFWRSNSSRSCCVVRAENGKCTQLVLPKSGLTTPTDSGGALLCCRAAIRRLLVIVCADGDCCGDLKDKQTVNWPVNAQVSVECKCCCKRSLTLNCQSGCTGVGVGGLLSLAVCLSWRQVSIAVVSCPIDATSVSSPQPGANDPCNTAAQSFPGNPAKCWCGTGALVFPFACCSLGVQTKPVLCACHRCCLQLSWPTSRPTTSP